MRRDGIVTATANILPVPYDYDLVCVGSGPAGQRAAVQAAKLGKRVAVIERQSHVGGVCIETGTIPSKTFREAVTTTMAALEIASRTLPKGSTPPRPTAAQLLARVGEVVG